MLDHEAIIKAYPDCVQITDAEGAFKSDGSGGLTKIELDQSLIDAARLELNKLNYRYQRASRSGYISLSDQLDQLYHDIDAGKLDKTGTWYKALKAVKDANP